MGSGQVGGTALNSGVYRIIHTDTGRCYVGSSVTLRARFKHHRTMLRAGKHGNPHLQRAWNKYGEDKFQFKVDLHCAPEMVLFYEQLLIDGLKPEFNISPTAGSAFGHRHSEEVRKTMGRAQRGWRKKYEWKGQSLCLSDIAEMEGIDHKLLISRVLGTGMPLERAVSLDRREMKKTYEHDGRSLTIKEWAAELDMHPRRITYWLDSGMTIAQCIERLNRRAKAISFSQFCKLAGFNLQTAKSRLQKGMGVMDAVTIPAGEVTA